MQREQDAEDAHEAAPAKVGQEVEREHWFGLAWEHLERRVSDLVIVIEKMVAVRKGRHSVPGS
jgi:hypothetical protein